MHKVPKHTTIQHKDLSSTKCTIGQLQWYLPYKNYHIGVFRMTQGIIRTTLATVHNYTQMSFSCFLQLTENIIQYAT